MLREREPALVRGPVPAANGWDDSAGECDGSHPCGSRAVLLLPWAPEVCAPRETSTGRSARGRPVQPVAACTRAQVLVVPSGLVAPVERRTNMNPTNPEI